MKKYLSLLLALVLVPAICSAADITSWNGTTIGPSTGNITAINGASTGQDTGNYSSWNGQAVPANADPYIKSLLHLDGADNGTTFTDETGKSWSYYINAVKTKTGTKKFGTASGYFTWPGSYQNALYTDYHADFDVGASDFTLDFWVYSATGAGGGGFIGFYNPDHTIIPFGVKIDNDNTQFGLYASSSHSSQDYGSSGNTVSSWGNTWRHIALVRQGTSYKLYVGGALYKSATVSGNPAVDANGKFSIFCAAASYDKVYVDELRFSLTARWTADFTPPTAPY